ncbi:nucleotide-binding domain-containing protein [Daedaleopsis nitida]|nr:nucleotide-binding domain-containing protein [Daedaleopsis nitida]
MPLLHINFERTPLVKPIDDAPHVLVIGAGIIGLSTAWTLLDSGFTITVLAEHFANRDNSDRLTSQIAGALWEFPPAVCGHAADATALESSKRWAMVSYHVYKHMAADPVLRKEFSVQMRETAFFFLKPVKDDVEQLRKMREIERSGVAGFRHDTGVVHELGLDKEKWVDAYELLSSLIDTDKALSRITELVRDKGATFVLETIDDDLFKQEQDLLTKFSAHAIVNASGLGSYILADDNTVYPLRGAVLRLLNDGQQFKKVQKALVVSANDVGHVKSEFIFIVPRNESILYVGGFSEPDEVERVDENHENVLKMARDAEDFLPGLDTNHRDPAYPIAQGLRPARLGDVRVEREPSKEPDVPKYSRIVHCYGHAGAGWSLAFGSALEVKTLVKEAIDQLRPRPMKDTAASTVSQAQVSAVEKRGGLYQPTNQKTSGEWREWLALSYKGVTESADN